METRLGERSATNEQRLSYAVLSGDLWSLRLFPLAKLDRAIRLERIGEEQNEFARISALRDVRAFVLLGEPGAGKSSVFEAEAEAAGATPLKVQAFLNGAQVEGSQLFLDGLDEYRADGSEGDKIHKLAAAITAAAPTNWRLSCRSEDWRKAADLEAFKSDPPKVAHLLPLEEDESAKVLTTFGETDPEGFLRRARELGAHGFLDNPLSLRLLHKAVSDGGDWPHSRYELFTLACDKLAHELNTVHRVKSGRPSPERILRTAERACLFLLLTDARLLWRSNAPIEAGRNAALSAFDVGEDEHVLNAALDTTLFRGEGEAFEPLHRTIAEFLAARALACNVIGGRGRAALPMSRALALLTGLDSAPPSELRGLYAWFAVHLANLNQADGAARLIAADPFSVLAYGDAAALSPELRRDILARLHERDPYFRASEDRISALGGLAGEDMADAFRTLIEHDQEESQRLATVFDVLSVGKPVHSLTPLLNHVFADPERSEWVRRRAAQVLQHYAVDKAHEQRRQFDLLDTEGKSVGRSELRVRLLGDMPPNQVRVADVRAVVTDYAALHRPNFVGTLEPLRRMLEAAPMAELFNEPVSSWYAEPPERQPVFEVRSLLEGAFAGLVHANPDATPEQLWTWIGNEFERSWLDMPKECAEAVASWMDIDPAREIALFDAIVANQEKEKSLWLARQSLNSATHRAPSSLFFEMVMKRRAAASDPDRRLEWSRLAVALTFWSGESPRYWQVFSVLENDPAAKPAFELLTQCEIDEWRTGDAQRKAQHRKEKLAQRAKNVDILSPLISELREGRQAGHLAWGAEIFFSEGERNDIRVTGLELLASYVNDDISAAMAAGWDRLVDGDLCGVSVEMLGKLAAKGRHYVVESAAMAGLLCRLRNAADFHAPIEMALLALRNTYKLRDKEERARVWTWARDRLDADIDAGSALMVQFWDASLKAGAHKLEELWKFREDKATHPLLARGLRALLENRKRWPDEALREALAAAAESMPRQELADLAASKNTSKTSRRAALWRTVKYALDLEGPRALARNCDDGHGEEIVWKDLFSALAPIDAEAEARRAQELIETLGPRVAPQDRWGEREHTFANRMSEAVRGAIDDLSKAKLPAATSSLAALVANAELLSWRTALKHAAATQVRARRDDEFRHPPVSALRAALDGGTPANNADLKAVSLEELHRLARELHTGTTSPWKGYWNRDVHGRPTDPLVENECRNHLLERLADRLKPYGVAAALPEATRGPSGRSDMLIVSYNGRALPIEAKRHDHADLWTAPMSQLRGYAAGSDADGSGIYLVFWFGENWRPLPKCHDGRTAKSAHELRKQLIEHLGVGMGAIDVVVFDVSNPAGSSLSQPQPQG